MEKYLDIYRAGVTIETFPIVTARVYADIKETTKTRVAAEKTCMEALTYIIDNTDAGEHDKEIDAIMKRMLPGLVDAFFDLAEAKEDVLRSCSCFRKCIK